MRRLLWVGVGVLAIVAVLGSLLVLRRMRLSGGDDGQAIVNPTPSSGKQTYHLEVDGIKREFVVYRPSNIAATESTPVVFMFHPSGSSGPKQYDATGWKQKADEEGLTVVFPSGLKYHLFEAEKLVRGQPRTNVAYSQTKWNSYEVPALLDPAYPDQTLADDLAFTDDMIDFLKTNYSVDTNRFYATGYSNGAQFCTRLAVERSDVFAAFAPTSAGIVGEQVITTIQDRGMIVTPRPVIQVLGTADPLLKAGIGVTSLSSGAEDTAPGTTLYDWIVADHLALEHLTEQHTYEHTERAGHYTYSTSTVGADNEYQLYMVDGMGHIYPNGDNVPFDVADLYWDFFKQYTL